MDVAPIAAPVPLTAHAQVPADAGWLLREFSDLRSTLERFDANLTSWQRHGRTYPSHSVQGDYDRLAQRFDTARVALRDLRPQAGDLNARLQADALLISRIAGQVDVMSQHQTVFGSGWSTVLDGPIRDVITAVDLLLAPAAS